MTDITPKTYRLDEDTQELIEIIFTWAQQMVDLQQSDELREDMQTILTTCADRMNIPVNTVTLEEAEDGTLSVRIQTEDDVEARDNVVDFPIDADDDGTRH